MPTTMAALSAVAMSTSAHHCQAGRVLPRRERDGFLLIWTPVTVDLDPRASGICDSDRRLLFPRSSRQTLGGRPGVALTLKPRFGNKPPLRRVLDLARPGH